jgi:SlyX protein
MKDKIISLETRIAYLENTLDEMNKTIYRQNFVIESLRQKSMEHSRALRNISPGKNEQSDHEIPPHY